MRYPPRKPPRPSGARTPILVEARDQDTFLYDPHGIHYTGALKLLRGWLGSLHMVTTVYYQDFVYTEEGYPAMAFLADNYDDIRYGVTNFGYNQVTSYKSFSYQELAEAIPDRQTANPRVRRLIRERAKVRDQWGRVLVERKRRTQKSEQFVAERQTELDTIDRRLQASGLTSAERGALKVRGARLHASLKAHRKREERASAQSAEQESRLQEQLAQLQTKVTAEAAEVSRLELLLEGDYRRLNFGAKWYLDAARVMARNLFGLLHKRFRPLYENYRNDHQLLRELIQVPGVILASSEQTTVILLPSRCYSNPQRNAINQLFASVKADLAQIHSGKPVRLRLLGFGHAP